MGEYAEFLERQQARRAELADTLQSLLQGQQRLVLEIGCGHGHWLTAYAEEHPNRFCLGFDLISKRIRKANAKCEKRGLQNLHFLKAHAEDLLSALPGSVQIEDVFILFPDPWPKKRHFKNRLMQDPFLARLAAACAPGARLHYRTDHEGYFDWTLDHVAAHPDWELDEEAAWPFENPTVFQNLMSAWQSLIARRVS